MKDDADTLTPEPAAQTLPKPPGEPEPAFITRARRILTGNIRPDDYLEVTPDIRRRVKRVMDEAVARGNGQPPAAEVELRQVREETLSFHHGGQNIAYIADENGIVVLGVGLEEGRDLLVKLTPLVSGRVWFGAPAGDEIWL